MQFAAGLEKKVYTRNVLNDCFCNVLFDRLFVPAAGRRAVNQVLKDVSAISDIIYFVYISR